MVQAYKRSKQDSLIYAVFFISFIDICQKKVDKTKHFPLEGKQQWGETINKRSLWDYQAKTEIKFLLFLSSTAKRVKNENNNIDIVT